MRLRTIPLILLLLTVFLATLPLSTLPLSPSPYLHFNAYSRFSTENLPANAGNTSSISGSGRYLGEGNGNPVQFSCLGNPMERGAWQVLKSMGSQKSQTRFSN